VLRHADSKRTLGTAKSIIRTLSGTTGRHKPHGKMQASDNNALGAIPLGVPMHGASWLQSAQGTAILSALSLPQACAIPSQTGCNGALQGTHGIMGACTLGQTPAHAQMHMRHVPSRTGLPAPTGDIYQQIDNTLLQLRLLHQRQMARAGACPAAPAVQGQHAWWPLLNTAQAGQRAAQNVSCAQNTLPATPQQHQGCPQMALSQTNMSPMMSSYPNCAPSQVHTAAEYSSDEPLSTASTERRGNQGRHRPSYCTQSSNAAQCAGDSSGESSSAAGDACANTLTRKRRIIDVDGGSEARADEGSAKAVRAKKGRRRGTGNLLCSTLRSLALANTV
jgi:hypothetical protein